MRTGNHVLEYKLGDTYLVNRIVHCSEFMFIKRVYKTTSKLLCELITHTHTRART